MRRKVVLTGAGVVSAVGDSPAALYGALTDGRRGAGIDFNPGRYFGARNARPLDRISQLAAAAAGLALADAGCTADDCARRPVGLVLGTVFSGVRTICAFDRRAIDVGPEYASPLDFANTVLNAAAGQAAIWHNLRGPNATMAAGVASGLQAIIYGAELIAAGAVDAVLAGGADERSPEAAGALDRAGLTGADDAASTPFAEDRAGMRLGEAAAFVMLEADGLARSRGASVRAGLRGFAAGHAAGADGRLDPERVAAVLRGALADAELGAGAIDVVGAAASGSLEVDACEARALALALRDRERPVAVMAVKSAVGEALGASGALQVVAMLESMRAGALPGIAGLERSILDERYAVARGAVRRLDIRTALIDAFGWDGQCSALAIDNGDATRGTA